MSSASVSDAHSRPGRAEGRRRQRLAEEQLVDVAAQKIDEEPQPEDAVHNRGHAGEVIHGNADQAGQGALAGILAQIDCGHHAERCHQHRHQHHHHHGAEDRRENAALGVGLARIVADELPELGKVEAGLVEQAHGVWPVGTHNVRHRDIEPRARPSTDMMTLSRCDVAVFRVQSLLQNLEPFLQRGALALDPGQRLRAGGSLQFQSALLQPQAFEFVIDGADVAFLQLTNLASQFRHALQTRLQFLPCRLACGDALAVLLERLDKAVEVAPLLALEHHQVRRARSAR